MAKNNNILLGVAAIVLVAIGIWQWTKKKTPAVAQALWGVGQKLRCWTESIGFYYIEVVEVRWNLTATQFEYKLKNPDTGVWWESYYLESDIVDWGATPYV